LLVLAAAEPLVVLTPVAMGLSTPAMVPVVAVAMVPVVADFTAVVVIVA
jgi:hypothetical protein